MDYQGFIFPFFFSKFTHFFSSQKSPQNIFKDILFTKRTLHLCVFDIEWMLMNANPTPLSSLLGPQCNVCRRGLLEPKQYLGDWANILSGKFSKIGEIGCTILQNCKSFRKMFNFEEKNMPAIYLLQVNFFLTKINDALLACKKLFVPMKDNCCNF